MKKVFNLFLIVCTVFLCTGCYCIVALFSGTPHRSYVESIKVYDEFENEINGELIEKWDLLKSHSKSKMMPLNSPAPTYNYYCIQLEEVKKIRVEMIIKCNTKDLVDVKIGLLELTNKYESRIDKIGKIEEFTGDIIINSVENDESRYVISFYLEDYKDKTSVEVFKVKYKDSTDFEDYSELGRADISVSGLGIYIGEHQNPEEEI